VPRDLSGYPRAFWVLLSGQLLNSVGTSLIFPFLTVYLHEALRVNLAVVGAVLLAQGLAQVAAVSLGGLLADAWGRVPTMTLSLGLGALTTFALATLQAPLWVILLVVLRGGAMPLFQPAAQALVADLVPKDRLYGAFSVQRIAQNAGVILGPMLGALLLQRSFAMLFLASSGILAVFTVLSAVLLRRADQPAAGRRAGGTPFSLRALRDPYLLTMTACFVLISLSYSQLYWVVPGYLTIFLHLPASRFGFLAAENAALVVVFQLPLTALSHHWRSEVTIAVGAGCYALGFSAMTTLRSFLPFLVPVAVISLGEILVNPSIVSLVARRARPDDRGKLIGLVSLADRGGAAVGPAAGGSLLTFGGPALLFPGTAAIAAIAACGYLLLGRRSAHQAAGVPADG